MKLLYENIANRYHFFSFNDMNFPAHLHADLELCWLTEGSMDVTIGQHTRHMVSGELAVIFPYGIHSYRTEADAGVRGIMVICSPDTFGEFLSVLTRQHPVNPILPAGCLHKDIPYCLESLSQNADTTSQNLPAVRALIHLILARLLPCLKLEKNLDSQSADQTTRLLQYLSEHFTEAITLQTLADYLHISRYSVSRIFSEKLSTSYPHYINTLRIDYAQKLLRTTDLDILSVSEQCGYDTLRTFNREFRAICGCSPRAFQKSQTPEPYNSTST